MRTQQIAIRATLRVVRLAGLSAAVALMAGAGAKVYAAAPGQTDAPAATPVTAQAEAAVPVSAGDTAATTATVPVADTTAPAQAAAKAPGATDAAPAAKVDGKKVKVKKVKVKKEKPPKMIPLHIAEGTLTVDGWTGKARLNYDISDLKYIYVWAPGIGTVVASNVKFPMAKEEQGAFNQNNLTLDAGGHTIQISSENKLLKNKKPVSAWVYVDTTYHRNSGYPEMGYGAGKDAPYAWPGAKQISLDKTGSVDAPPLPVGLRPTIAKPSCTPGAADASQAGSTACPAPTPASKPTPPPPVPLPGYKSGTTTAEVTPAPAPASAH